MNRSEMAEQEKTKQTKKWKGFEKYCNKKSDDEKEKEQIKWIAENGKWRSFS